MQYTILLSSFSLSLFHFQMSRFYEVFAAAGIRSKSQTISLKWRLSNELELMKEFLISSKSRL